MPFDTAATRPTPPSVFGNDFPEHAPQAMAPPRPMLEDAFAYAADRLDRLEHLLGSLNGNVMRAGHHFEPLLTDSTYVDPDSFGVDPATTHATPTPEDRRSTIAKRVSALGDRADNLADAVSLIERRLEAILDASEL
jgi:hypothetical protein